MSPDTPTVAEQIAQGRQRAARRPWLNLLNQVLGLTGGTGELVRHAERPWASVMFTGTRHTVTLAFTGPDAVAAGEAFIAALPDHEFAIPGQLVADATITSADHTLIPAPRLTVEAEFLLLDES